MTGRPLSVSRCASRWAPRLSGSLRAIRDSMWSKRGRVRRRSTPSSSCARPKACCPGSTISHGAPAPVRPCASVGPRPSDPAAAIDEAEYDLAILDRLLKRPAAETVGAARYLLHANPHLGRALRFRAERWNNVALVSLGWARQSSTLRRTLALRAHDISKRAVFTHGAAELRRVPLPIPAPSGPQTGATRGARAARGHRPAAARVDDARGPVRDARGAPRRQGLLPVTAANLSARTRGARRSLDGARGEEVRGRPQTSDSASVGGRHRAHPCGPRGVAQAHGRGRRGARMDASTLRARVRPS